MHKSSQNTIEIMVNVQQRRPQGDGDARRSSGRTTGAATGVATTAGVRGKGRPLRFPFRPAKLGTTDDTVRGRKATGAAAQKNGRSVSWVSGTVVVG